MKDRQKILIVDDQPANLYALEKILAETDTIIIKATSGYDALKSALNNEFALAILDVRMPEMDGYELAEHLRGEEKTRNLPIIFLSAVYSEDYYVFKGYEAGGVDYIVKPYNSRILLSKVNVFLQLDRQNRELWKHRKYLEDLAYQRTDELKKTNKQLREEIDERRQAEKGMERAARQWRTTFDAISDSLSLLDLDGTILRCNEAMRNMLGKPYQDIVGRYCWEIVCRRSEPIKGCPLVRMRDTGRREELILPIDGRWVRMLVHPVSNGDEGITGAVHVMSDITENIRMEQERIQLEKMSSLGTMAAGIAHELNNPMMAMFGFSEYCLKHTDEEDKRYGILEDIMYETKRCIDIVGHLLTFSRTEKKDEQYDKESLAIIFDRVLRLLSYRIENGDVLIAQKCSEQPPEISIKTGDIQQVFLNLMTNALDAVKESEKKEIHIDIRPDDKFIQITVVDTGCGIPPENLKKIFDPFFTTKPVGQGTGLGLSVSQSIIKSHGGTITCESELGAGSKFKVLLPIEKMADA